MRQQAKAANQHVSLFSDAQDSEQPGNDTQLVATMRKAGITISVIGLGTDKDVDANLLKDIAKRGEGNIYFTDRPTEIPRIFAQDTFAVARNTFIKEEDLPSFHGALMGAPNRDQRDCVRFILFTGLRSEEARALSWDEVDFERKLLNIPEERNKGKRPIVIPMSDLVLDLLVERRGLGREGRWVFPASFRYRADSPGYVTDVRGAIEHAQKTGGVFPYDGARGKYVEGGVVKVHDLRRTFVTVASQCDMSPFALQALSNHAPSAGSVFANHITGDYVQITEDRLREPAQRVADRFKALIPALADPQGANVAQLT